MTTFFRALDIFVRSLIVTLCFIIDVKVKADVVIEAIKGQAEFEKNHEILSSDFLAKLPSQFKAQDFDVQTFEGSFVRFSIGGDRLGVASGTIISISRDQLVTFARGRVFFSVGQKSVLKIRTPQGSLNATNAEFLVDVGDGKTKISVLSGAVDLKDRAANKVLSIKSGYTRWVGGLLATGRHAGPARSEACELEKIMEQVKPLMGWSDKDYQVKFDAIVPVWKAAVVKSAEDSQGALDKDIDALHQILKNEKDFEDRKSREQAKLRKLFRAKAVGMPGEGAEFPADSNREPSSDAP